MPFNIKKSLKYQAFKMDFKAFLFLINILIYLDFTVFGHKKEIFELEVKHAKQINELNVKIENLEKENEKLTEENKILKNDNDRMKSILNKDSSNSSIPPSKDEKPKKKRVNLREKSNKKTGGQKGHKGATFTKQDVEELLKKENVKRETIEHGKLSEKYCITKYEIDTKTIVIVKEHKFYFNKRSEIKIPKEFVEILTGGLLKISEGSLVNWLKEKSRKCRNTIKKMKIRLKNTEILQTDLTETKVSNKKGYVRNYSNDKITVYIPSKDKKIHRVKRQWILDGYTGYIVQDHDTAIYNFGIKEKHVECNVHLRRYLKNNAELTKHKWSQEMDKLLLEIKKQKEEYLERKINRFTEQELEEYSQRYDEILKEGRKENRKSNSKYLGKEEKALLNRLKKYKTNHLIFAYNFEIPFDNNLSKRDLRPIKTKKKVSGCHRSYRGLKDYCNIRSIISTCKKQGIDYFKELVNIEKGNLSIVI